MLPWTVVIGIVLRNIHQAFSMAFAIFPIACKSRGEVRRRRGQKNEKKRNLGICWNWHAIGYQIHCAFPQKIRLCRRRPWHQREIPTNQHEFREGRTYKRIMSPNTSVALAFLPVANVSITFRPFIDTFAFMLSINKIS